MQIAELLRIPWLTIRISIGVILMLTSCSIMAQAYYVSQNNSAYDMEEVSPINISIADNTTKPINIGFNFSFFGSTYTTCYLAENGFIQFGPNPSGGCCAGQSLPSTTGPNNVIAAAWMNGAPTNCCFEGDDYVVFQYETIGVAPNRRLVITMALNEACDASYSGQIKLFEGTDIIEIHTETWADDDTPCSNVTQGIENGIGNIAFYMNGRNANTSWSVGCCGDMVRFTPSYSMPQNDAGISYIFNTPYCEGPQPIEAIITNYGILPLNSVTVNWNWAGILQNSFVETINPPLLYGTSKVIELGVKNFVPAQQYVVTAWTTFPNGQEDNTPANDPLSATLKTGVKDTFTIGGSSPDFTSFASAISLLTTIGVCDTVWMHVRPGTYNEQLTIPWIPGAASSRVIFTAENGDSSSVILQFDPTVTNPHVLKFNNAAGITWERMTLNALGTDYGKVIEFSVHSFDNTIQHCAINGINTTTTTDAFSCIYSSGTNNDNTFQFNTIKNGSVGINHQYASSNIDGFFIHHNKIENFSSAGIRFTNAGSTHILQNSIISTKNNVTGIDISGANDSLQIASNLISLSSGVQGINLANIAPPGNVQAGVYNNMVYVNHASGITYGIYSSSLIQTDVYHNTVKVSGPNSQNVALRIDLATQDSLFNNLLSATGGGYVVYLGSVVSSKMDYNGYHHIGAILGKYTNGTVDAMNLENWHALTGYDNHSIFYPPHFLSATNLHLGNSYFNGAALPTWTPETDIDGDERNITIPDIGADEFDPQPLDASISSMLSPNASCATLQPVKVVLKNLGLDELTEATVHWSLNGIVQAPVLFSGEIQPEGDTAHVTLQAFHMFSNATDMLKFWADDLNGETDMYVINDTLTTNFSLPLSGEYTIGGSSPNFATITAAVNAMNVNSVCGPVTFLLRNGTYTEQISISNIEGVSSVNTITFRSQAQDSSAVTIQFNATTNANYIVQLQDAHYVRFEYLGFKTVNTTNSNMFYCKGTTGHITVEHCYLEGRSPTISTGNSYLFYSEENSTGSFNLRNNYFLNGTRAIFLTGSLTPSLRPDSFLIDSNIFVNQRTGGILTQNVRDVQIKKNIVTSSTTATYSGIQLSSSHGINRVSHNKVNLSQTGDGITISGVNAESTLPGECRVFNNMSSVVTGTAIVLSGNRRFRLHFNSAYSAGTIAASHHAIRLFGGDSITVRNNIAVANTGRAYSETFFIPVADVNYNDFYTSGTSLALRANISYANLSAWRAGTGLDLNSVSIDPMFLSGADLHILSPALNGVAQPVTWITTDFDDQIRNPLTPDIGADEIGAIPNDAGVFDILPEMPFARGTQDVKAIVRNYGSNPLTSAIISWKLNGVPQPDYFYNGELLSLEHDTVILGQITFALNTPYQIVAWTKEPNLTNDIETSNDTIHNSTIYPAVSGVVIVGATGELPTISNAVNAMYLGGILDDVRFEIQPGTYHTSVSFTPSSYLSCGANVVFTSTTENAADVIWDNTGTGTHTILFDGADGITIRNLTIKTVINAIQAIRFQNASTCHLIEHCVIQGVTTTNTSSTYAPVLGVSTSSANYNPNNTLQYNTITNGSYGVYWDGFTGTTGLNISHNLLQNARVYGMWMHRLKAPTVHDNTVTSNSTIAVFKGIYFELCAENTTITANKILLHGKRSNGIELFNTNGTVTLPTRIANNYIILGSGAASYGLYTNTCTYINVYHNTIRISGGDNTGINIRRNLGGNVHYLNNILDNQANGKTMQIEGTATPFTSNYNAHYSEGTNKITYLGTNYTTLAAWQATGRDLNSILEEPVYDVAAPLNYVITNSAMNGTASATSGITTDIEGMPRDLVTPDMGCDEYNLFTHDVGLVSISYPHQPYAAGTNIVYVKFINNGEDMLTSMQVNWKVNGVSQPVYYWTGLLPSGGTYDSLDIGEYNFIPNFYHDIKAWVSLPNGVPDQLPVNDTLDVDSLYPALNGIYTVGGIDPDFETLSFAVAELNKGGASANVTFNIRTGTYLDTILLRDFPGSDCNRNVTFQSETGNAADVLITNLGLNQHTIRLNGADGVIFQNLRIESVNPAFRHVISYYNGAHCNQFLNNQITGYQSTSTSTTASVIHSDVGLDTQNVFSGNLIRYGSYGMYLYGGSSATSGTTITDNEFYQPYYRGIYAREEQQISITSNTITAVSGNHTGIQLYLCHYNGSISGNNIQLPFGSYGMYIDNCDATVTAPGLISNNFISIGGSSVARGILITESSYQKIIHNNIFVFSTHVSPPNTSGVYATSCPSLSLLNNVLSNAGAGYAIFSNNNTSFSSDYNNLLTTGTYTGYWNGTSSIDLAAWRTTSGQDQHSLDIDPYFMSSTNLHVSNILLNGQGSLQASVPYDIDGEPRQDPPDIGADEFDPAIANDAGVFMAIGPVIPFAPGVQPIEVALKNFGGDTLIEVNIRWLVNGIEQPLYSWTGNLPPAHCDTVTIGTYNFPQYTGHDLMYWTESPNNVPDSSTVNDTLYLTHLYPALSGTYTVGGILPDFNLFSQVQNALGIGGILGNVIFSIRNGTYATQLLIEDFPRTSASHSVTFKSEQGDSSLVTLIRNFNASDANNYTIRLKDAHRIRMEHITLASTKGLVVDLTNGSSDIEISHCQMNGVNSPGGLGNYQLIYSGTTTEDSILILNNRFEYGDQGIYLNASSGALEHHVRILDNTFYNCNEQAIYSRYSSGVEIRNNRVLNSINRASGIYVLHAYDSPVISGNDIRLLAGGVNGMYMYWVNGTSGIPASVHNNYIYVTNGGSYNAVGIRQEVCEHVVYRYNTVRIENSGTSSVAFYDQGSYQHIHIRNCIFANYTGGLSVQVTWSALSPINSINYTDLYSNGSILAYYFNNYTNLASLQVITNQNLQGMSAEPLFNSEDPDVFQAALNGTALPISGISTDIYGAARMASTPDVGAREFTLPAHDIGAKQLESPETYCGLSNTEEVTIRIQNYGANAETAFNVAYKFGVNSWVTENVGALVVQPGGIVDYTFSTTLNLSQPGVYSFALSTFLGTDLHSDNDSLFDIQVEHKPALVSPVVNMLPADQAIDLDKTVNFSWSPALHATLYDVYIWKTSDPVPVTPQLQNLTQINKNYSSLLYGQSYFWKVIAKNTCNQMVSGVTQQFTVRDLPDLIVDTLISPLTAYTGQPIDIEWVVKNTGTGATQGALWSDAIYLSSDATLNVGLDIYLGAVQNLTALEDGIAYTNEATFTLPNNTVGNYYIFVYTDRFSSVIESENGNNWSRSSAVAMIQLSPYPDLDADVVVASPLSFSGQSINVQYTIENDGTAATGLKTWHDRIWLTTDQNNPGQFILGTIPHTGNLQPDSSYSKALSFTVPNGLLGEFYVFVQSDFHNVIFEFAAESNNTLVSDSILILLTPPADFVMTNIMLPDTISSDYNNSFSWTVSNMGAGPSMTDYWKDDIYISPAPVFNSNFNVLFKQKHHSQVVPSMSMYTKNESSNKMILPSGLYYIYGFTDSGNKEYEFNMEGNNIYADPTPVFVGNPDLLIRQPEFPDTVGHMSPFTLTWNQINQGYGRYEKKSVRTKLYGSDSPVFNPQTALLIQENVAGNQQMGPLDTLPKSIMITMPPQLSGEIYFHFHVNPNGTVYESAGDSNNIYSSLLPVYVSPPDLPDLEVIDFTIPDTVIAGTSFAIQYATQNSGNDGIENTWEDDVYISFESAWMPAHALKLADIIQQADLLPSDTFHTSILLSLNPETNENVYYIYVVSDEKNNFFEGPGESNNIERSGSFYVKGAPVVDLAIDTCTLENAPYFSGGTYSINWITTVMSEHDPVINTWKDHAFLSTDQTLDTLLDIRVGLFTANTTGSVFDQDSPFIQADDIALPQGLSGSFYLILQSDFTLLHHDTLRTNNTRILKDANGDPKLLNIQLSPAPDLIISSFVAPANVFVSQSFPVQVCISNTGDGIARGPWENQVYLSTDMLINSGDVRLSLFNTPSNDPEPLFSDSTVCHTVNALIPPSHVGNYFLIARTDPINRIYEHGELNNTSIREIEVSQPLPSDLIVTEVTVPFEAIAGEIVEISWKTKNAGSNPAYGAFREVVYLSPDTIWSVDDPVFGVKNASGYLPPLSVSSSTLTEQITEVVEGDYHAIVRTDVQQQINEEDDTNNDAASLDVLQVNVKTLVIDTVAIDSLTSSNLLYYRVIVHPGYEGESLLITMQGDSSEGLNELYVKFGGIPTRGDFDFGPQQSIGGYQHVIIPALEVGTYYIAAYCATQNNEPQVSALLATILPFEILSISPNVGVKDKQVTVEIRGIKLDQTDRFRLRRSDPWFEVIADPVYVHSDNRVYATFDLTDVPLDTFQLDGVKSNDELAVAPESFIVVENGEPELQITAFAPTVHSLRPTPVKIVINFINTGMVDVVGAVVEVEAPYGNLISPTLDALRNGEGMPHIEVSLNEPNGPPGIIRPGGSGTIEVFTWNVPGPTFVVGLKD